jgi:UDP-glucose 4-epimerase
MIYIENLCFFLLHAVESRLPGVFFPQNAEYVNTTELFKIIRKNLNKNTYPTKIFNPLVYLFMKRVSALDKLFGGFAYKGEEYESIDYIGFEESVKRSVLK